MYYIVSVSVIHHEHNYSKNVKGVKQRKSIKKMSSQTEISSCNDSYEQILTSLASFDTHNYTSDSAAKNIEKKISPNKKVLLNENGSVVAKATTMSGSIIHGDILPPDLTKVAITEVFNSKAKLHYRSYLDDDCCSNNLLPGMITAWKNECISIDE